MIPSHRFLAPLQALHRTIRDQVVAATERAAVESLSHVHADGAGDTIYAIDKVAEDLLVETIDRDLARTSGPVVLVAEGLEGGRVVLPRGATESDAKWTVIVDPIDGTRGLMYQKRPAWILTGVAPYSPHATLGDVVLAVQTEIPLVKQHLCDELWAVAGQGAHASRVNRLTGAIADLALRPSTSSTLAHGFATVARFFPGVRAQLAALEDEVVATLLGPPVPDKAQCFEDQYISTGGQLYELIAGHDRFVADLRSIARRDDESPRSLCCHPYDLCSELIARESGAIVTGEHGRRLDAPLNVEADVSWVGYANPSLHATVEPVLRSALARRGWI